MLLLNFLDTFRYILDNSHDIFIINYFIKIHRVAFASKSFKHPSIQTNFHVYNISVIM